MGRLNVEESTCNSALVSLNSVCKKFHFSGSSVCLDQEEVACCHSLGLKRAIYFMRAASYFHDIPC